MSTVMVSLMGLDAYLQCIAQNIDATLPGERCYLYHGIAPGWLVNKALRTMSHSLARCERTAKAFAAHSSWDRVQDIVTTLAENSLKNPGEESINNNAQRHRLGDSARHFLQNQVIAISGNKKVIKSVTRKEDVGM